MWRVDVSRYVTATNVAGRRKSLRHSESARRFTTVASDANLSGGLYANRATVRWLLIVRPTSGGKRRRWPWYVASLGGPRSDKVL